MPNKQEEKEPKKEVLDLIGGSSKKKRAPQPAPAPAPSRPAPVKKEALDLLSGNKKKASRAADAAPAPAAAPAAAEPAAPAPQEEPSADDKIINLKPPVSVSELAGMLKAKPFQIIKDLMGMGIFANPNTPLDADAVSSICDLHGYTFAREKREKGGGVKAQQEPVKEPEPVPVVEEPKATLITRTPIITVMGHVDHGKTSLLDYIRKTRVAKGEAGGITQHIGAYTVDYNGSTLTFLDTPGHAIFTEMRARGADVTDIVVLVVAANDGIMPQTREAIAHSKAAGKTIIVAINKCDLPAADPVKTKSGLMEEGLVPTDFGGDVECVEVSALTGAGIDDLLGLLVLQSEVLELQANPKANCRASIIEARVEPGTGSSATAIVESGTIRVGMPFICGPYAGKVRALVNDHGERVKKVGPGMPVEITGFSETPNVGDELVEMENERAAKKLGEERQEELRKQRLAQPRKARMEELLAMMGDGTQKAQLKILLKGDVQGSVEAVKQSLVKLSNDEVIVKVIHAGVGAINESDVILASASNAIIIGFNVRPDNQARDIAERENVDLRLYRVIYQAIEDVEAAMKGMLDPKYEEKVIGTVEVRQTYKASVIGTIAGSYVLDGMVTKNSSVRVTRGDDLIYDGPIASLKRFKDDVKEVKAGYECGIVLEKFNDIKEGDMMEVYTMVEIPR